MIYIIEGGRQVKRHKSAELPAVHCPCYVITIFPTLAAPLLGVYSLELLALQFKLNMPSLPVVFCLPGSVLSRTSSYFSFEQAALYLGDRMMTSTEGSVWSVFITQLIQCQILECKPAVAVFNNVGFLLESLM